MTRQGRPPKAHHLKVIEGNPGKRRLVEPPKPSPDRPRCPQWLPTYAKTTWRRLVPLLDDMGILTTVDRETMTALCLAVNKLKASTEFIAKAGFYVKGQKGNVVRNPATLDQAAAMREIALYSSMFGLSPTDRVRLLGSNPGLGGRTLGDDLEAILAGDG